MSAISDLQPSLQKLRVSENALSTLPQSRQTNSAARNMNLPVSNRK